MVRLSAERIFEVINKAAEDFDKDTANTCWFSHSPVSVQRLVIARAIEREAYKAGQERMRERAAKEAELRQLEVTTYAIRNLEIEEPK